MTLTIELSPQRYTEPASGHSTFRADAAFAKAEIYEMPRGGEAPRFGTPGQRQPDAGYGGTMEAVFGPPYSKPLALAVLRAVLRAVAGLQK